MTNNLTLNILNFLYYCVYILTLSYKKKPDIRNETPTTELFAIGLFILSWSIMLLILIFIPKSFAKFSAVIYF